MALRDYLVGRLPPVMLVLVGPVDEILAFVVVEVSHEGRVPLPVQIEFGQNLRSFLWEGRVSKTRYFRGSAARVKFFSSSLKVSKLHLSSVD